MSKYYLFGNDTHGDDDIFEEHEQKDDAIIRARELVENDDSRNVIVCPVIQGIPTQPVYHVRFVQGYGIEEPIKSSSLWPYRVQKQEDGWHIVTGMDSRDIDGGKPYPSRQNAYRRCRQLNSPQASPS